MRVLSDKFKVDQALGLGSDLVTVGLRTYYITPETSCLVKTLIQVLARIVFLYYVLPCPVMHYPVLYCTVQCWPAVYHVYLLEIRTRQRP